MTKPKILFLHGAGTNADIFRLRTFHVTLHYYNPDLNSRTPSLLF